MFLIKLVLEHFDQTSYTYRQDSFNSFSISIYQFLLQFFLLTLVGNNEFYNIETKISMFKSFGDEIKRETYSDFVVNNNEFIILPVVKMNS